MKEEEKPEKRGRKVGSKNKVQGKIIGEHKKIGRDNRHLNQYQGQTRKEFMKVRDGESQADWEKRTAKRTLYGKSKDSLIKGTKQGKLIINSRKLHGMDKEVQLRIYRNVHERMFDFMRVYALIMKWASVRHDVLKDDIEIGYNFYNGMPFTKEEFNQYCMMGGYVKGVFARFYKKGYIQKMSIIAQNGAIKDTQYYVLTAEFTRLITTVYGLITKTSRMQTEKAHGKPQPSKELMEWIVKANEDIEDTLSGLKKQDKINYRNED
jgi:hypothetical protein